MLPLSTLIEVLKDYDGDGSFDPDCVYDTHLLAAYIICQGFEKMRHDQLPQASLFLTASVVLQGWLKQDGGRWTTTYQDAGGFCTELMNGDKTLEAIGRGSSMSASVIKAIEELKL